MVFLLNISYVSEMVTMWNLVKIINITSIHNYQGDIFYYVHTAPQSSYKAKSNYEKKVYSKMVKRKSNQRCSKESQIKNGQTKVKSKIVKRESNQRWSTILLILRK